MRARACVRACMRVCVYYSSIIEKIDQFFNNIETKLIVLIDKFAYNFNYYLF